MIRRKHRQPTKLYAILLTLLLLLLSMLFGIEPTYRAIQEANESSALETQETDSKDENIVSEVPPEGPTRESGDGMKPADEAFAPGDIVPSAINTIEIKKIIYQYDTVKKEAWITDGSKAEGHVVIPKEIEVNGTKYLVTAITSTYNDWTGFWDGAFLNNKKITGLTIEDGSRLREISDEAFKGCENLVNVSLDLPETLIRIGKDAFKLDGVMPILRISHKHILHLDGALPDLAKGDPLTLPPEALLYDSRVDSSKQNTTLHKGAKWTNEDLTEAELRIDYGKNPNLNAKMDFIFVMDHSSSMLIPAEATGSDGTLYEYPRVFITNDLVVSIASKLLNQTDPSYDNRVALVAFGQTASPLWTVDFTKDVETLRQALFNHPISAEQDTHYGGGLNGVLNLLAARSDESRTPVVIFLSDGLPRMGNGLSQASTLRQRGVKVYPIGIYTYPISGQDPIQNLKALSFDGETVYDADNTDLFEEMMMEVVWDIIEERVPLNISIQDTLSDYFELATGNPENDIQVASDSGKVSVTGDQIVWNLSGCAADKVHHMIIKIRVKPGIQLSATGRLPTNSSMGATDGSIESEAQPVLERYLVHHLFVNGNDPGQGLDPDILSLCPPSKGGFPDGTLVLPSDPLADTVKLSNGEVWRFVAWTPEADTIDKGDVTFVGTWRRALTEFAFLKTDLNGNGLEGVGFDLYFWEGGAAPPEADAYVTAANTIDGKWKKVNDALILSGMDGQVTFSFPTIGIFQLVESQPLNEYYTPEAQWRFDIDSRYEVQVVTTIPASADAIAVSDFTKKYPGDQPVWYLENIRKTELSFLKISTVHYHDGEISSEPLDGAEFELYFWRGNGIPSPDALVSEESAGQWQTVGRAASQNGGQVRFVIPSKNGWYYQLVEKKAPENYNLPSGQWRISFAADGSLDMDAIQAVPGADAAWPPPLQVMEDGTFAGQLVLTNIPVYLLPEMGGHGKWPFLLTGASLLLGGHILAFGFLRIQKKRSK